VSAVSDEFQNATPLYPGQAKVDLQKQFIGVACCVKS
jgi:hypothetical protein